MEREVITQQKKGGTQAGPSKITWQSEVDHRQHKLELRWNTRQRWITRRTSADYQTKQGGTRRRRGEDKVGNKANSEAKLVGHNHVEQQEKTGGTQGET